MKQEYRFVRTSRGHTVDHIVRATKAIFEDDALVVEAENRGGGDGRAATYLRRDDAIDLAWSILEHYRVTERPEPPLAVGDLVEIKDESIMAVGRLGRIGYVTNSSHSNKPCLVNGLDSAPIGWFGADQLTALSKEEFLKKASERAARFVGDDDV